MAVEGRGPDGSSPSESAARGSAKSRRLGRRAFLASVAAALEASGERVAVLYVEIDRFRSVNAALGHAAGDEVLEQAVLRVLGALDSPAILTGHGGELAVLLPDAGDEAEVFALAENLRWELAEPYHCAGQTVGLTASIGIAFGCTSAEVLLQRADAAAQAAGESGGNRVGAFEPRTQVRALTRVRGGAELREALNRSEFRLHYQPALALGSEAGFGVEALIRWISPDGRVVMPANFIPLAEETGFIVFLGSWVFEQACAQLVRWGEEGLVPSWLSVNLSARQLYLPESVRGFEAALSRTGADPRRIVVEITESALMEETPLLWQGLQRLRELGIKLSIDDFGTRYSSLAYLRRFDFDTLKVDRSFTSGVATDTRDRSIVGNVITLAHDLALDVVVEGIENGEQLRVVRELGADWAQGFHLSRPIPAEQLPRVMAGLGAPVPGK